MILTPPTVSRRYATRSITIRPRNVPGTDYRIEDATPDQPHFDVRDACGAPNGFDALIRHMMVSGSSAQLRLEPRFDPLDERSEHAACSKSPLRDRDPHSFEPDLPFADRVALVRYLYLASHWAAEKPERPLSPQAAFAKAHPPPQEPHLVELWSAWREWQLAADRAKIRYKDRAAAERHPKAPQPRITKPGRRGNVALRTAMDRLVDLFSNLYGVPATQTNDGPAMRFAAAFFEGIGCVDGRWIWTPAVGPTSGLPFETWGLSFETWGLPSGNEAPPNLSLAIARRPEVSLPIGCEESASREHHLYVLNEVQQPAQESLRSALRSALSRAALRRGAFRPDLPGRVPGQIYPVPGAFGVRGEDGGVKWGTADGKKPLIHGLVKS